MKLSINPQLFLLFVSMLFVACSSDDSKEGISSISITAEQSTIEFGQSLTFTVKGDNGQDVTSESTILVNDDAIEGNTFQPPVVGTYSVKAQYGDLTSETISIEVVKGEGTTTTITISAQSNVVAINDDFIFTVMDNTGKDITDESTIYVDNTALTDNIFTTTTAGSIEAYAVYDKDGETYTSETKIFDVKFTKRILIEDFTGTWCGYCPRVMYALENLANQTEDMVMIGIHRFQKSNPSAYGYDPFTYNASVLENQVGLSGYPFAMLDRDASWKYPEPSNLSQAYQYIGSNADVGIKMTSNLNGGNLDLDVDIKFLKDFTAENLKLVVYVLEDGIIHDQVNYTSYFGGVSIIKNYEHNHVLRASLTGANLLGEAIPSADTGEGQVYSLNFDDTIPSNVSNSSNISFAVFVLDGNGIVLNARDSKLGDTQVFE